METNKEYWRECLNRYRLSKRIRNLREEMKPKEIYGFINCSKQYLNAILNFRFNAKNNFINKLEELENEKR